jgi:hypothetical protein
MVCKRLEIAPLKVKKERFFAQKEQFFHPKISLFCETNSAPAIYFQQLPGFGRVILTSFLHSASLDAT